MIFINMSRAEFVFNINKEKESERERERDIKKEQDLLGQVSRLRKREGQKYVNFYGKS